MNFLTKLVVTLSLCLSLVATSAKADQIDLRDAVTFIEENSNYVYNDEPLPELILDTNQSFLQVLTYGPEAVAQAEMEGVDLLGLGEIVGVFDHEYNRIYIWDDIELSKFSLNSVLVHEMVHYMQWINGEYDEHGECLYALEPDAYKLQNLWIEETNDESRKPDLFTAVVMAASCQERNPYDGGFR